MTARPLSSLVGRVLRGIFRMLLALRRPRPIHPHGLVLVGTFRRLPGRVRTGIRWVDDPGDEPEPVVARASRSVGVPPPLPDVVGLALRFRGEDAPADLELASTGFAWPSRFWLHLHRSPSRARLGTLFPYRTPAGPLLICARTISPPDLPVGMPELGERLGRDTWRLRLYTARPRGRWRPFGELELRREPGPTDELIRFDAAKHPLPGADQYGWATAAREPSYSLIQGRGDPDPRTVDELLLHRRADADSS